jgi:hypothetical protein
MTILKTETSRRGFLAGAVSAVVGMAVLKSQLLSALAEPSHYSRQQLMELRARLQLLMDTLDLTPYRGGQYTQLFASRKSHLGTEVKPHPFLRLPHDALLTDHGSIISVSDPLESAHWDDVVRYIWHFHHKEAALGFAVTPEATDEQLIGTIRAMCLSFQHQREVRAAAVFNSALVYDPEVGGDGCCLLSTDHPHDGGVWANTFSEYRPLTPANLMEAVLTIYRDFVDDRGLKIMVRPRKLVVPVQQATALYRMQEAGTFPHELFPTMFPDGWTVNDYLQDPDSWYILTDVEGLYHFERISLELDAWVEHSERIDEETNEYVQAPSTCVLGKGYERYSFGCGNPRAVFGVMRKAIAKPDPTFIGLMPKKSTSGLQA